MGKSATEVWSHIKEKYWGREWDIDEMLAEDEHSRGRLTPADE